MNKFFPVLANCPLFDGIDPRDLPAMLGCLGARVCGYEKNQPVFREGEPARYVGIVLSGGVQVVREDYYGNRSIVAHIGPSELFGESFACAGIRALPVSAMAAEASQIMLIDCQRITTSCSSTCIFHNKMIFNLLKVVAQKNLVFHQKIEITSKRTTREKLMAFLMTQAKQHKASSFTIPYDRQGLADYLGVDRSAMAAEISKLRREGIIACEKSHFQLL